jgi:5-deoxy-glucuronate isomerase
VIVLPLSGSYEVSCAGQTTVLKGRTSVFAGPTDFAYAPPGAQLTVTALVEGRVAVPTARAEAHFPFRRVAAMSVPIELRGAGSASREVRNFAIPDVFDADRLIACEVITPAGGWSSYPPHKHDEPGPAETALEELYFFQVAEGPSAPGMAYQRVYASPGHQVDVLAEVRTGDLVLVPGGWHGPTMAPPGYDLYHLNVMAGSGDRAWRITVDPDHAWVMEGW